MCAECVQLPTIFELFMDIDQVDQVTDLRFLSMVITSSPTTQPSVSVAVSLWIGYRACQGTVLQPYCLWAERTRMSAPAKRYTTEIYCVCVLVCPWPYCRCDAAAVVSYREEATRANLLETAAVSSLT